jgi:hypothetical protein
MLNVLLLNAYSANHAERLRHLLTTKWQVSTLDESEREASLEAALRSADALVTTRYGLAMPPAPRLKLIQTPVSGTTAWSRRPSRLNAPSAMCMSMKSPSANM